MLFLRCRWFGAGSSLPLGRGWCELVLLTGRPWTTQTHVYVSLLARKNARERQNQVLLANVGDGFC